MNKSIKINMRIGVDIRPLLEDQPGGVSIYTHELLRALFHLDQENQYLLFSNASRRMPKLNFNAPNIKLTHFNWPNKILNTSLKFLKQPKIDKLISRNDKLDIFFMPNLNFIALSKDTPLVLTIHDLSFETYPSFLGHKERLWHKLINPVQLMRRANRIIAVSEHTKNDLTKIYNLNNDKIDVTHLGVNDSYFKTHEPLALERVKEKYDLPKKFILCLCSLEPRKNIETIIEAFALLLKDNRFNNTHLVLAGRISKPSKLKNLTSKFGLGTKIKTIGYVNSDDKPLIYNLADVFVYPSYYEGFGLPPLEAMASGVPVVASFASSISEVIGNSGILIDPYNVNDLLRALASLLTNKEMASKLGLKGCERAKQFTWDLAAQKTLNIFKKIKNRPT